MYKSDLSPGYTREYNNDSMGEDVDSAVGGDIGDLGDITTSSASPDRMVGSDEFSDDREENFECFGENDDKKMKGEFGPTIQEDNIVSPNLVRRNSWLRTSLRRTSPNTQDSLVPPKRWGSFRHHGAHGARSSAALASALFNSGPATSSSFNSSGRSSNCDDGEMQDHHSDTSLEDDVVDLNNKVQQLQEQVGVLVENQATTDDRYTRTKKDNAALTARIHMLEEHIRELEGRGEERLDEEQRRNKDMIQRLEREKQLEIENYTIRLQSVEKDHRTYTEEVASLRAQVDKVRGEKVGVEEQLMETQLLLTKEQEGAKETMELRAREVEEWSLQNERSKTIVDEMSRELEELRRNRTEMRQQREEERNSHISGEEVFGDLPARISEMETEIRELREQNKRFQENNEELQAQMLNKGLEEGMNLLNNQPNNSLAAEFEAMSENEMRTALKDQQDVNVHLRSYIDNVLLNIMDKYPELLEIRNK